MRSAIAVIFVLFLTQANALDLDREVINVAYLKLPSEPIADPAQRTYSVAADSLYMLDRTLGVVDSQLHIHGFERLETPATIDLSIQFEAPLISQTRVDTERSETTDRDGNSKVKYSYTPVLVYATSALATLKQPDGQITTYRYGDQFNEHVGSTSPSRLSAVNYFEANLHQLKRSLYLQFVEETVTQLNSKVNSRFGYQPIQTTDSLLILDSKKYPEYSAYKKAYRDISVAFDQMTPFDSLDTIKAQAQPVIDFLDAIPENYPKKKRAHKKMRYASYYNLGQIYYYLDELDRASSYFQKVVDNDYREGESERMLKRIQALQATFTKNAVTTRHFPTENR